MIVCTARRLEDMPATIADHYNCAPQAITISPAAGDADQWVVNKDGYYLPGLRVIKDGSAYFFKVIGAAK